MLASLGREGLSALHVRGRQSCQQWWPNRPLPCARQHPQGRTRPPRLPASGPIVLRNGIGARRAIVSEMSCDSAVSVSGCAWCEPQTALAGAKPERTYLTRRLVALRT